MGWSIVIGRVAGTAVRIHLTFALFLAWIGWANFADGGWEGARSALGFTLAMFACVLAHEFGHIFAARRFGVRTPDVTLLPIGGVARLERIPESPWQEIIVALAGPAVNVVIALLLIAALGGLPEPSQLASLENPHASMLGRLAAANLFLAAFNLIPAFPMDGGRVLRALLALRMDRAKATRVAAGVGQALAFVFMLFGFMGQPMLFFIAIFVWIAASTEAMGENARAAMSGLKAADGMETKVTSLAQDASLDDAIEALLASSQQEFPVVDALGRPTGVLTREGVLAAVRAGERSARVGALAQEPARSVPAQGDLTQAAAALNAGAARVFTVVDSEGRLVGLLTRQNVAELMMIRAAQPGWTLPHRG